MKQDITVLTVLRTPPKVNKINKQKLYSESDVKKIKLGFDRFLDRTFNFVCLTDQKFKDKEITTIPLIGDTPTWWSKLEMFRKNLFSGPVLYIDLDMVIINELDSLVDILIKEETFCLLGDPNKKRFGSGMIYFNDDFSFLWNKYCQNPYIYQKKYKKKPNIGDQAFIKDNQKINPIIEKHSVNGNWFRIIPDEKVLPETKILVCKGHVNKLHKGHLQKNEYVKKFWNN